MTVSVRVRSPLPAITAALLLAAGPAGAATASFQGLGDLPGGTFGSIALGVSADGTTVVGRSEAADSHEAFLWTAAGGLVPLGGLDSSFVESAAWAVSADGSVVVGESAVGPLHENRPFRWTAATGMVEVGDSTDAFGRGQAFDVSADGSVIVGVARSPMGNEAYRWTQASGMVGLGWLPSDVLDSFAFGVSGDGSVVCGLSFSFAPNVETFRWTQVSGMVGMGDVPGGLFYAIANDVSADGGTIVGEARTQGGTSDEAFLWTEAGGWVQPDPLHGLDFASSLQAASADGSVAVGYGENGAMIWDAAHGMRNVAELLELEHGLDLTGWTLGSAYDVSDDGTVIAGVGLNPGGQTEAWIATLPPAATHADAPGDAPRGAAGLSLALRGPNPFVSRVELELALAAGSRVRAAVYGVDGGRVRTLLRRALPAGTHPLAWDGTDRGGRPVQPGVYWVRAETDRGAASCKVVRRAP